MRSEPQKYKFTNGSRRRGRNLSTEEWERLKKVYADCKRFGCDLPEDEDMASRFRTLPCTIRYYRWKLKIPIDKIRFKLSTGNYVEL